MANDLLKQLYKYCVVVLGAIGGFNNERQYSIFRGPCGLY